MHLVRDIPQTLITLLPVGTDAGTRAANDSGLTSRQRFGAGACANQLVARVVGRVAAGAQPENVNIELHLAAGEPVLSGDPVAIEFAVAGILAAQVQGLEEGEGGVVRVAVCASAQDVKILMTTDDLPPLRFVRALDPGPSGDVDATVLHCRRVIEAQGGTLALTEQFGRIGFSIAIPRVTLSPNIRQLPDPDQAIAVEVPLRAVA